MFDRLPSSGHPDNFTPMSDHEMLRNCKTQKRCPESQTLQASAVCMLKFMAVQLGKRLNKYGFFGKIAKRKPLLSK